MRHFNSLIQAHATFNLNLTWLEKQLNGRPKTLSNPKEEAQIGLMVIFMIISIWLRFDPHHWVFDLAGLRMAIYAYE